MARLERPGIAKAEPKQVAAVIDVAEFEADAADQEWREALRRAREHVESLERAGRSGS